MVKSVVTTTSEHQPLSEGLVTRGGNILQASKDIVLSERLGARVAASSRIQVDLLKILVCVRYAPRYISPVVCRMAGIGARRLQAASRRTRCASSTSVCRTKYGGLMQRFSNLRWISHDTTFVTRYLDRSRYFCR